MQFAVTLLLLTCLCTVPAAYADSVTPVQKVLELLSDLESKIIKEGEASQKLYDEFSEYCEDTSKDLGFEIKTAKAAVADLKASIDKDVADIEALNSKIDELVSSVATAEADLKAATEIREKEQADFAAEEKDLTEVVDTLERAIAILEREMAKGASMIQLQHASSVVEALRVLVQASAFSAADASRLTALLQSNQGQGAEASTSEEAGAEAAMLGAPDPAVYKGHSSGIIETLEGLLEKAESQLAETRKTETANLHNYEMLKQSLEDEIKFGDKDLAAAKGDLAASSESKAAAEGDLEVTTKDLEADVKSLADLHHDCFSRATDFEEETKSRGEELKALAIAKKVIAEQTSPAEAITYSLGQASFLQVVTSGRLSSGADLANFEAVRFVRDLARKEHSPALAQLASRMASAMRLGAQAGDDPFAKVKGLIADMIERLEKDAEAEASHKAYCDKEMSETTAKKEDKTAEIEKLTTKIDQATARSAQLKEEVATLQKELAELTASQAEMDKIRADEKALYDKSKPEMEEGIEAVKMALKVLREYYAKGDKSHEAAEGAGSSVIGLLEVVESDFTKTLAEMMTTEETAVRDYEKQTKENEITKTMKEQDVKYKTKEFTGLDKAVAELTSDREGVQTELDAILEYLSKLNDMCIAKAEPYAERKARRDAEIAGLKEALQILEGEAVLLQGSLKTRLRGIRRA